MRSIGNPSIRTRVILFAAAILMIAGAGPAAAATQSFQTDEDFSMWVPCVNGGFGESVDGLVKLHQVYGVTRDGAGGLHIHLQASLHGAGVGSESGDTYRMALSQSVSRNLDAGGAGVFSYRLRMKATGLGNAPDFNSSFEVRFVVNANGEVAVFKGAASEACSGDDGGGGAPE